MTPKFLTPTGKMQSLNLATVSDQITIRGEVQAPSVLVSVRGEPFTDDPLLIQYESGIFQITDLDLIAGENIIQVKANDLISTATIYLVQEDFERSSLPAPSGLSVDRYEDFVEIKILGLVDERVLGYNLYASIAQGGGSFGFKRVNPEVITSFRVKETTFEIGGLDSNIALEVDINDDLVNSQLTVEVREGSKVVVSEMLPLESSYRKLKTSFQVDEVITHNEYYYRHDRRAGFSSANPAIPDSTLSALSPERDMYYIATAVYDLDGVLYESPFSPEIKAKPLSKLAQPILPAVSREQIVRDQSLQILRRIPDLDIKPGSFIRDVYIDPMSSEVERLRFIFDFFTHASNLDTLLQIDDPDQTGQSLLVSQSAYKRSLKQAFYLVDDFSTQALIDNMFDLLASNFGVSRQAGTYARGEVLFYTTQIPTSNITIPIGTRVFSSSSVFRTTTAATISPVGSLSNYDPQTGRFFVTAFVEAEEIGEAHNFQLIDSTELRGLLVESTSPTYGGKSIDSNLDLVRKCKRKNAAISLGSKASYLDLLYQTSNVYEARVLTPSSSLVKRGDRAVDIWVRSNSRSRVIDTFALDFGFAENVQFQLAGDPQDLIFEAVGETRQIIEVLNHPLFNFKNLSQDDLLDLTDVQIVGVNKIQLSSDYNDEFDLNIHDVFIGSYRYRLLDKHVLSKQPVNRILSVSIEGLGAIPLSQVQFSNNTNPFELGQSSKSEAYVEIADLDLDPIEVVGESHVVLDTLEYVNKRGASKYTLKVYAQDRSVEYKNPYEYDLPDYQILEGDFLAIQITEDSDIVVGQTLLFDYYYDPNLTVTYEYDSALNILQQQVDEGKPVSDDVLLKKCYQLPVDIEATVVLSVGYQPSRVRPLIIDSLSRLFGRLEMGGDIHQSDLIRAMDLIEGVDYIITPLSKLSMGDKANVVNYPLTLSSTEIESWSTQVSKVFISSELPHYTVNGGGVETDQVFFYVDSEEFEKAIQPDNRGVPFNRSEGLYYIIGAGGLSIPGYNDEETLSQRFPFASDEEILAKKVELSRNRVIYSTNKVNPKLEVTYAVYGDRGSRSLNPGEVGVLVLGKVQLFFEGGR